MSSRPLRSVKTRASNDESEPTPTFCPLRYVVPRASYYSSAPFTAFRPLRSVLTRALNPAPEISPNYSTNTPFFTTLTSYLSGNDNIAHEKDCSI